MDHRSCGEFESSSQAESATRNPLGNNCDGMGKSQKVKYTKTAQGDKTVLVLTYAAKQTDQGKKSVTLWFEQEKDQGYRLMMVDATNLLNAKEKTSSEKEITTEKEKKGTEFAQLIQQLGNPQRLVWGKCQMAEWAIARLTRYQGSQKW